MQTRMTKCNCGRLSNVKNPIEGGSVYNVATLRLIDIGAIDLSLYGRSTSTRSPSFVPGGYAQYYYFSLSKNTILNNNLIKDTQPLATSDVGLKEKRRPYTL